MGRLCAGFDLAGHLVARWPHLLSYAGIGAGHSLWWRCRDLDDWSRDPLCLDRQVRRGHLSQRNSARRYWPSITKTERPRSANLLQMPRGLMCKLRQRGRDYGGPAGSRGIDPSLQPSPLSSNLLGAVLYGRGGDPAARPWIRTPIPATICPASDTVGFRWPNLTLASGLFRPASLPAPIGPFPAKSPPVPAAPAFPIGRNLQLRKHTEVTRRAEVLHIPPMGRHILFKCPRLGTNVQHWLPETPPEDEPNSNSYVSVVCLACTRLHFIHKETGKLLGED